jgi:hypothetical protein
MWYAWSQSSELGLIGACFFMKPSGERSLQCCDARDRHAVSNAAWGKECRTNPATFIDQLVKGLCKHRVFEGGPYTRY